MEANFFKEIEKKMDIKTLKDFEKEIRTEINHDLDIERKTNQDLARIQLASECELFGKVTCEGYSWLKIKGDKNSRLFKLLEIYSNIRTLKNEKVERRK